ncbi:HutD family protein [Domibacillus indicus]|uniref:HutD/Ves family protein n=1 Tax=Domibacillus indicus TaxID=1437523 RepID=UPI0020418D42|nr:HutD family protein [Domibacillus indicus]MCM3790029.1 HutD family protein [Domibacillus indicus]
MIIISCSFRIIKREDTSVKTWAGGTTTELAIFPENADYYKQNFSWRLSVATIDQEESLFTSLPGVHRITLITDGEMYLEHDGHYNKFLKTFEQDAYAGEWITRSKGKVKDFNIMLKNNCEAEVESITLEAGTHRIFYAENKSSFNTVTDFIYCLQREVVIKVSKTKLLTLQEGDLLLINRQIKERLYIDFYNNSNEKLTIIKGEIFI